MRSLAVSPCKHPGLRRDGSVLVNALICLTPLQSQPAPSSTHEGTGENKMPPMSIEIEIGRIMVKADCDRLYGSDFQIPKLVTTPAAQRAPINFDNIDEDLSDDMSSGGSSGKSTPAGEEVTSLRSTQLTPLKATPIAPLKATPLKPSLLATPNMNFQKLLKAGKKVPKVAAVSESKSKTKSAKAKKKAARKAARERRMRETEEKLEEARRKCNELLEKEADKRRKEQAEEERKAAARAKRKAGACNSAMKSAAGTSVVSACSTGAQSAMMSTAGSVLASNVNSTVNSAAFSVM
eukprot:Blabericola_migrator_1__7219@NODE_3664_length_1592_cov_22_087213_g2271_i0_p1_GENE_NODE_3664_length_1592_cov_22_087213_g2271_i0NODE_3664_length_1592_cov_22_087213_g2271_i0_p1_ORF_typecomplete_len294_score63_05AAA_23/PF13476_6/0_011AspBHydro_N/PF05279_11/0_12DDRGK/PF09756_9/0_18MRPS26/PF14943_6/0_51DUF2992/PF11208_8/0_64Borrelia_P83/PF05262_11/0_52Selenoprotein_S/PF06936_11/0_32CDC37_N/PF03234_14/0_81Coilin_N/PF15862_5/0_61TnsD/PF15978_5/0_87Hamartin/PF04388_12/0_74AAA_13/PF13166_6/0_93SMC_N/PF024